MKHDPVIADINRHLSDEDRLERLNALIERRAATSLRSISGMQEVLSKGWETEEGELSFCASLVSLHLARKSGDKQKLIDAADCVFWWLEATACAAAEDYIKDDLT